jgi:lactoylglutathione lyase
VKAESKLTLTMLWLCLMAVASCTSTPSEPVATATHNAHAADAAVKDAAAKRDAAVVVPAIAPYITAAGIGVSDLEVSSKFYQDALGLTFKYDLPTPNWDEKVLEDSRANSVVLMHFKPERNSKKNPVKIVFYVPSAQDAYQAVLDAGGTSVSAPTMFEGATVALTADPDGYTVELVEVASVSEIVIGAMGIGVSSLDESTDFYTRVMGLQYQRDYMVPGFVNEKAFGSYLMKGIGLVLMHFEDETRVYQNIPAKVVFGVRDAEGLAKQISDEDASKVLAPPTPYGDSGLIVGIAKDLEGYLVEIIQSQNPMDAGVAGGP